MARRPSAITAVSVASGASVTTMFGSDLSAIGGSSDRRTTFRLRMSCIPPEHSAEFMFHMEDVVTVYHRSHDPQLPGRVQQAADRQGAHPGAAAPGTR